MPHSLVSESVEAIPTHPFTDAEVSGQGILRCDTRQVREERRIEDRNLSNMLA
jgi:hypothetical protein